MSNGEDFFVQHRDLVLTIRESLLNINDALERKLGIFPTTAQIRRGYKDQRRSGVESSPVDAETKPLEDKS